MWLLHVLGNLQLLIPPDTYHNSMCVFSSSLVLQLVCVELRW